MLVCCNTNDAHSHVVVEMDFSVHEVSLHTLLQLFQNEQLTKPCARRVFHCLFYLF